jgi:ABC-type Fe3+-siderophore transport system permease subunit
VTSRDVPPIGPAPFRTNSYARGLVITSAVAFAAFCAAVLVGPTRISVAEILDSLRLYDSNSDVHLIARDVRLPRALLALIVGGSLGAAGAAMQGVTRNPLAGPSIMGLSGGGTLAGLVALVTIPGLTYNGAILASLVGASLGYGAVLAIACLSPDGFTPTRLTLAGAVVSALLSALTQGLVIALALSGSMLYWTAGGIANVTWAQVAAVLPCCAVGLAIALWLAPSITVLSLGAEVAVGLGQRTAWVRVGATVAVLLLTGAAVAVAGPIAFVGLMVPHLCRLVVGGDYRRLVPLSTIVGAALTETADVIARTAFGLGQEIPLGVVTAVIGAPCFVWLVRSRGQQRLDGGSPVTAIARTHRRPALVLPLLAGLLMLVVVIAVHIGYTWLSPGEVARSLFGYGNAETDLILWSFRLPRIAFALLVGSGVAVSGAVLQGVLRNDLAEPGILGISAGASLTIVLSIAMLGYGVLASTLVLPVVAICGALAAILLVCALCVGGGQSSPRLLLTGVAVSSLLSAVTLLASMKISAEAHAFAVAFSAGSLSMADWNFVAALALWLGLLVPLAWSYAPTLNVLRLGENAATGLGVQVSRWSFVLLSLAVAICASCMALAGGMLFLGLVSPHIARRLVGADHVVAIPAAALVGALLLVGADLLGSHVVPMAEIPAGIMVSALGALYFLFLLTRR